MTTPPAPAKGTPRRKATAARDEVKEDGPKTFTHGGLTLTLPREMPNEVLFDMIEAESAETGVDEFLIGLRILRSIVGQDQFTDIRNKVGADVEKTLELMNLVLDQYGLTMGESPASPDS